MSKKVIKMSDVYELSNGSISKLKPKEIDLHKSGYYSVEHDKIKLERNLGQNEVEKMDDNTKSYIDQRVDILEKSLDQKFEYQQNIFSEKIDHLNTKTEKFISEKFTAFKEANDKIRKEDRKFIISTAIAIAAIAIAILGFLF